MIISVCIATYNGASYIKPQLESILSQLSESDEVIISDDGSTDNTVEIINGIADPRVRLIFNCGDRGYTNNFENALRSSVGDYIFLSDQDDLWLPGKVNRYLEEFKQFDFIVSDCKIVDENLQSINSSHFGIHNVQQGFFRNYLLPRYVGACMAFNRNVLDCALPFPYTKKYIAHDYWLSLVAELKYKVCIVDEPYLLYRRHSNNTSNGGLKSSNSLYHKIMVRIVTGVMLCKLLVFGSK